ncbi:molybdenum cofactor guanylyltransferase [Ectothiorhodospiraceae bacterium 2226]|nr:molybdenum cofactor guanylyltransferase [Ectothiorhodospiraceae bacterium 2226]
MASETPERPSTSGIILAGGRSRRMGGQDKGLLPLAGRPLAAHVRDALAPQVQEVLISANRHREAYAALGCPVVGDDHAGFPGPLAGIAAAAQAAHGELLLVVPCDMPRLPRDLAERLWTRMGETGAEACAVHDGERLQPLCLLMYRRLAPGIEAALAAGEQRVQRWLASVRWCAADFADRARNGFVNVNTAEDLAALEEQLAHAG